MALGLRHDPFTQEDEESLRFAADRELKRKAAYRGGCGQASHRSLWKEPVTVSVAMPVSTQYGMLTLLACFYHIAMFFCIIAIENNESGRHLEMKRAFMKMSKERESNLRIGTASAHTHNLINNMLRMLQE